MKRFKSILQDNEAYCYNCGRFLRYGEWHHVFNAANKKKSEKYGLMVRLCLQCHTDLHTAGMQDFKKRIQLIAMNYYGWSVEQFREIFGKSYI